MKTKVIVTVEVREVRDVRRYRHLSHEHREKISRSLRERYEETKRLQRLASGRCFAGHPNCTCHYCLRAAKYNANRASKSQTPAEAFTLLQEYATTMQSLLAKVGLESVTVDKHIIAFD